MFVPAYAVAGRIAHAAIDAFDCRSGGEPRRAVGPDGLDRIVPGLRWRERAPCLLPFLEERPHVGSEILDHRQILERPDLEPAAFGDPRHMGATGPARPSVDRHGAGAAHSDPTRETIRE